jgi:hypothetical protein
MTRILMGLFLVFSLVFSLSRPALAQPAEVIIIRHAEKPAVGNELTQQGRERAAALVTYFRETPEMLEFNVPVAIYVPLPKNQDSSIRSAQTVAPLASALHLTLNSTFHKDQVGEMAKEILSSDRYEGKMVLICWDHKMIPDIAKAIGVEDAPEKWHGESFDRTWVIKFQPGAKPIFRDLPQRLMFGDSAK